MPSATWNEAGMTVAARIALSCDTGEPRLTRSLVVS